MYFCKYINYFGIVTIFSCIYSQQNHALYKNYALRVTLLIYIFIYSGA